NELTSFCPDYHRAVELIGRRWTGAILRALLTDVKRFNDLAAAVPGLSDRMLAERLKELETEGVVVRNVFPETPVRVEYRLTEKGRALEPGRMKLAARQINHLEVNQGRSPSSRSRGVD